MSAILLALLLSTSALCMGSEYQSCNIEGSFPTNSINSPLYCDYDSANQLCINNLRCFFCCVGQGALTVSPSFSTHTCADDPCIDAQLGFPYAGYSNVAVKHYIASKFVAVTGTFTVQITSQNSDSSDVYLLSNAQYQRFRNLDTYTFLCDTGVITNGTATYPKTVTCSGLSNSAIYLVVENKNYLLDASFTATVDFCSGNTCGGHGSCSSGACTCTDGFNGALCNLPPCTADSCSGHGTCANSVCTCSEGWTGSSCSVDACSGNTCSGHGTCSGNGNCTCSKGYSGTTCQTSSSCGVVHDVRLLTMLLFFAVAASRSFL